MTSEMRSTYRTGQPDNMRPRRADPLGQLLPQIVQRAGGNCTVERAASRPWASALFEGRRHVITLRLDAPHCIERAIAFGKDLGEAEWALSGHFVADITIDGTQADESRTPPASVLLDVSALTIEEW